jgi:hypothetical protein
MEEKEREAVRTKVASISKHAKKHVTKSEKPEVMINSDLKALVKWKKRKGKDATPSKKMLLLQRRSETKNCSDLTLAQFLEENGMQR